MGKQKPARSVGRSADALVKQGRKSEKRLLRLERQAEQSLTEARAKLRKAKLRLERRLSAVSDAEALLRTRQAARAAGPTVSNGASRETLPPPHATASTAAESPIILVTSDATAGSEDAAESAATLIIPPAAKPPARRRTNRSAAPKEKSS